MKSIAVLTAAGCVLAGLSAFSSGWTSSPPPATQPGLSDARPTIDPKPLSKQVDQGLAWLIARQRTDGGWNQGEESPHMVQARNAEQAAAGEPSNVADSCMALLALMRAGHTPTSGAHAEAVARGVAFVCGKVESADADSLWVTDVRNTRTQGKLGTYVDTYLAALVLGEVKPVLAEGELKTRVSAALDKTVGKMQRNDAQLQGENGWAVALSRGIRGKAMNKAAAEGARVDLALLAQANAAARDTVVPSGGGTGGRADFAPATDAAGIGLYGAASSIQQLQEAVNADRRMEADLRAQLDAPTTSPSDRQAIKRKLSEVKDNAQQLAAARGAIVDKLGDDQFVAGFGSNGGEEFLSYWAIGETLVTERDAAFAEWDRRMTENLNRVQNDDGSWSGHHCITGKTFCSASALLVLTVDRTSVPVAAGVRR